MNTLYNPQYLTLQNFSLLNRWQGMKFIIFFPLCLDDLNLKGSTDCNRTIGTSKMKKSESFVNTVRLNVLATPAISKSASKSDWNTGMPRFFTDVANTCRPMQGNTFVVFCVLGLTRRELASWLYMRSLTVRSLRYFSGCPPSIITIGNIPHTCKLDENTCML